MTRLLYEYLKAVCTKWVAIVTGGLIGVYFFIQPYAHFPVVSTRTFLAILAVGFLAASFQTWREERLQRSGAEHNLETMKQDILLAEDPRIEVAVHWPNDDVNSRPAALIARNKGRLTVLNFRIRDLRLGLITASFSPLSELQPDVDSHIQVQINGIQPGTDLLDALMFSYSGEIGPVALSLEAEVEKLNGQLRRMRYTLSYVPLSNPRRTPSALEPDRCLTVQRT